MFAHFLFLLLGAPVDVEAVAQCAEARSPEALEIARGIAQKRERFPFVGRLRCTQNIALCAIDFSRLWASFPAFG